MPSVTGVVIAPATTSETATAGEVYHWPAGHTATTDEVAVFLEVGPVQQMRQFNEHVKAIFAAR